MDPDDPEPASRPWVFNPRGFLLVVLEDDAEAARAGAALEQVGFDAGQRRVHKVLYFRYYGEAGVEEIRMP